MKKLICIFSMVSNLAYGSLQVCPKSPVATATSHQWVSAITASGSATLSQPSFTDVSGTATSTQLPATAQAGTATGNVFMTAATACPSGSISADGSSLLRTGGSSCGGSSCAALFAAISTTYGSADGSHFTLPNMQGVFARGSGSQTLSAITYTGSQGTSQGDQFQGHIHTLSSASGLVRFGFANTYNIVAGVNGDTVSETISSPTTDGSNGTPRTGSETRPANITLLYCIIY